MGIKVCDLVMEYKKGVKVLNHVNLTIEHGIYGLLGENGAGKTTLMKILVTLLTPTSGTVEINGLTVKPENYEIIKKQIGYLPQEFGLYPNLTVREASLSSITCCPRIIYTLLRISSVVINSFVSSIFPPTKPVISSVRLIFQFHFMKSQIVTSWIFDSRCG